MRTYFSERQTALRSLIMLMLVTILGLTANAQGRVTGEKQQPVVYISKTGYGITANNEPATYLNDKKFIEPAVIVYESKDTKVAVTNRFYISYYLTSGTEDGTKGTETTENGKTYSVDPTTGTRVNTRYGDIETGKTAGTVYVHVKAVPSGAYADMFNEAESCYRITLNKVHAESPVRITPDFLTDETYKNGWYAATGTTITLPKFKVEYKTQDNNKKELTVDITQRFKIKATVDAESASLASVDEDYKYASLEKGNAQQTTTVLNIKNTAGKAKINFSFEPIYENAYEPISDFSLDLNIVDEKVTPKLVFDNDKQLAYTGMQGISVQRPTVYDQFGNDITPTVSYTDGQKPLWMAWSTAALDEGKLMHTPQSYGPTATMQEWQQQGVAENLIRFGYGLTMYDPDQLNTGDIVFYKDVPRNEFAKCNTKWYDAAKSTCKVAPVEYKVYCQVYPKLYNDAAQAKYNASEESYTFEVKPRPVKIQLTPSPKDVKITKDTEINMSNRFEVTGVHTAEINDTKFDRKAGDTFTMRHNSDNQDFGCEYTLKFKRGEAVINNFPHEDKHIVVDKDNNIIEDPDSYEGDMWDIYWSIKAYGTDDSWTLRFLKSGPINLTYSLYPYNIGYYEDGTGNATVNETFDVEDKVTPTVKVTPNPIIIYTSDHDFPTQPLVSITDAFGNDIRENYDLTFDEEELKKALIGVDEDGNFYILSNGPKQGDYPEIKVTATPKAGKEDKYNPGETTFRIIVKDLGEKVRFAWNVYNGKGGNSIGTGTVDNLTDDDKVHGKLIFTGAGLLSGGYTIDAIPGLAVQIGNLPSDEETISTASATDEDPWVAVESTQDDNKVIVYGDPVEVAENGIPTGGTYYTLMPRTNGFLTLDAKFKAGNSIVLTDETGKEKQAIKTSADTKKEIRFRYPIYANKKYYLYNAGDKDSYEPLKVHGISFEPAFINQRNDMNPIEQATAYANGFAGALPALTDEGTPTSEYVSYDIAGQSTTSSAELTEYAEISKTYGTVKTKTKGTHGMFTAGTKKIENYGNIELKENHLKVYAEVKSAYINGGDKIKKVPAYNLYIGDIPTYVMSNGYTPNVLERISTTNYPTHIRAFFGGWENDENRPYVKNNKISETDPDKIEMLVDSWKTSKMDSVGSNNRVIDNFSFASFGTQNATSETVNGTFKYDKDNEDQTYNLPCRGTYIQFEPNEAGTIAVYIIQNGMVAYNGDPADAKKSGMNKIKLNPVFITDETGTPVKLAQWTHSIEGTNTDAYTEAVVRCTYDDILKDCGSIDSKSDATALELLKKVGYITEDGTEPTIKKGDQQQIYDIATSIDENATPGSQGYAVITKAYTRYSFRVKAGKSYFLFMNGSKLGNDGFAFMPDEWTPERKTAEVAGTVTLDEKGTAEGSKDELIGKEQLFDKYDKTVNVKLYHSFKPSQWTALSLPFSVNDTQFRKIFGDDALAISLDEIADKATVDKEEYTNVALFTQHNYHWIVAGRPYFVMPGKDFEPTLDEDGRQYIQVDSVTFENATYDAEGKGEGLIQAKNLVNNKALFNFTANYQPATIKAGDYFIGTKDGEAKLYRATKATPLPGYRAYISNKSTNDARIGSFSFGNINEDGDRNTTGISQVYDYRDSNNGMKAAGQKGVYATDGTKVAESVADIQKLPAGTYIVNGQTIVK